MCGQEIEDRTLFLPGQAVFQGEVCSELGKSDEKSQFLVSLV